MHIAVFVLIRSFFIGRHIKLAFLHKKALPLVIALYYSAVCIVLYRIINPLIVAVIFYALSVSIHL